MPKISVFDKDVGLKDELMILDVVVPYAIIYHSGEYNETRLDMHIKRNEAKALYDALKEKLDNQVVSLSVDR